ncbi:hypothetical protein [Litorihabitans aurantiacus]|uniref:Uncharacterized protein n=1 Tax=Litorihabitans aurantiacus TaxID=1930061 RepID=A0AA38CQ99_9MICO|nr:hypothetical protein [Litorihabitans aurantiacus]GMA32183.1 hypothetical protein GCM10025875_21750 [Litorihabitans aurantiacus]
MTTPNSVNRPHDTGARTSDTDRPKLDDLDLDGPEVDGPDHGSQGGGRDAVIDTDDVDLLLTDPYGPFELADAEDLTADRDSFGLPYDDEDEDEDDFDGSVADAVDRTAPLTDDAAVLTFVRAMVQTAFVERWWLLLLDERGVPLPTIPQIEAPLTFGEREADEMASMLESLGEHLGLPDLVLVWELPRTGSGEAQARASLLSAAIRRRGGVVPRQVLVRRRRDVTMWRAPEAAENSPAA